MSLPPEQSSANLPAKSANSAGAILRRWLAHPLTRGLDIDAPGTTEIRRRIVQEKPFVRRLYEEWYGMIAAAIPSGAGAVLELGSGPGFLDQYIPDLITSDLLVCRGVKAVLDAQQLPFADGSLKAIAMVNVLHHLPRARDFFREAARCVRPGGVIAMVEPWHTSWSYWVYTRLHFEPFLTNAPDWGFPDSGPLSGANMAIPWIILHRDRAIFEKEFPQWKIRTLYSYLPLRLLVSGGVSFRNLVPSFTFNLWRGIEWCLSPWNNRLGLIVFAVLERRPNE